MENVRPVHILNPCELWARFGKYQIVDCAHSLLHEFIVPNDDTAASYAIHWVKTFTSGTDMVHPR